MHIAGAAKQAHWNLRGYGYLYLHPWLDEIAKFNKRATGWADDAAERAVNHYHVFAPGDPVAVAAASGLPQFDLTGISNPHDGVRQFVAFLDAALEFLAPLAQNTGSAISEDGPWFAQVQGYVYELQALRDLTYAEFGHANAAATAPPLAEPQSANAAMVEDANASAAPVGETVEPPSSIEPLSVLPPANIDASAAPLDAFTLPADFRGGHTVTDDGRVYGYLARFGEQHGSAGVTVDQHDAFDYSRFHNSGTHRLTDGRDIGVGRIALNGGHNDAAYDDLANQVAHVRVGTNDAGVWYAGVLVDGATPEQVEKFKGSTVSGSWRNGELRAIVAVNAPGYLDSHVTDDDGVVIASLTYDPQTVAVDAATFTAEQRRELAETGEAMPDGSYPIRNRDDLRNAIAAIGRASDRVATQAHILARARALGASDELPDWLTSPDSTAETTNAAVSDTVTIDVDDLGFAEWVEVETALALQALAAEQQAAAPEVGA